MYRTPWTSVALATRHDDDWLTYEAHIAASSVVSGIAVKYHDWSSAKRSYSLNCNGSGNGVWSLTLNT